MSARPSRGRRVLVAMLSAGCVGAAALVVKSVFATDTPAPSVAIADKPPTRLEAFPLPAGTWSVISAEGLDDLARQARGEKVFRAEPRGCPLLPPGVEPLAERADAGGRVSAFVTGAEDRAVFVRHWEASGWTVTECGEPDGSPRPLALARGTARALAWVFHAAAPHDRVHLLVTVAP